MICPVDPLLWLCIGAAVAASMGCALWTIVRHRVNVAPPRAL